MNAVTPGRLIGLAVPGIARVVGALLVAYATALLWNGARATIRRGEVMTAVLLNAGWVVGSAAVILAGPLTLIGNLTVGAVAAAVLLFAVLEVVGLARHREAAP